MIDVMGDEVDRSATIWNAVGERIAAGAEMHGGMGRRCGARIGCKGMSLQQAEVEQLGDAAGIVPERCLPLRQSWPLVTG
jgi:hypothetical protein